MVLSLHVCFTGVMNSFPTKKKKKKKMLSTWIPALARPEPRFGLSLARAAGEGDRPMPQKSGCHASGLESAASADLLRHLPGNQKKKKKKSADLLASLPAFLFLFLGYRVSVYPSFT